MERTKETKPIGLFETAFLILIVQSTLMVLI